MGEVFALIAEVGFPIAMSLIGGFFIFLTIKYILESVVGQVQSIHLIVQNLDNRVKTMNHDMVRMDCKKERSRKIINLRFRQGFRKRM